MSGEDLPEALKKLVVAVSEDEDLRAWLSSFEETAEEQRASEFSVLAARMRAAGEHPELIEATELLANSTHYRAVCEAVGESFE